MYINEHKQTNSNDCSLFSIAFTTAALCFDQDPSTMFFDVLKRRQHLIACFVKERDSSENVYTASQSLMKC